MLSTRICNNLTLVLVALFIFLSAPWASATPHFDAPTGSQETLEESVVINPEQVDNLSITTVPNKKASVDDFVTRFNKRDYFYPYRQELELHVGSVFGIQDSSDDPDLVNVLLGFNYLLPSEASPKWEFGADLSTVGHGHVHGVRRIIFNEKGSFRPYYEYGLMHKFVPDEEFASFSNWENYLLLASVGLADIMLPPRSVQVELQLAVGTEDVLFMFTFGYAWGF
jgi:hypothetical protein